MPEKRKRIGDLLIEAGVIDEYQLKAALNRQERWGKKLGETLVEMGFITEDVLLETLSKMLNIPSIKLDKFEIKPGVLKLVPKQVCITNMLIPLATREMGGKKRLVVAMSDPSNYAAIDEIQFKTGMKVLPMVSTTNNVRESIIKHYPARPGDKNEITFESRIVKSGEPMEVVMDGNEKVVEFTEESAGKSKGDGFIGRPEDEIEGLERVSVSSFGKEVEKKVKGFEVDESKPVPKPFLEEEYEESTGVFRDDNAFNSLVKILKNKALLSDGELKVLMGVTTKEGGVDVKKLKGFKVLIDILHKKNVLTDREKDILKED